MTNPITQQIRESRHRLAARFGNDLDRIVEDLQRQQRESGRRVIDRSRNATNQAMQRSGGGHVSDNGESTPAAR
ncbi:hypothetical protein V7x_55830 [Crateriforma conspicua]|uniref:Uncharacterized protein n=1 Tax=Crateriforma conspicua TaxID=2527996 RepID=A0A5C6FFL4_9PLAN|nr:hypothetical protein V7x_55830 [Crateriforma conspicua]